MGSKLITLIVIVLGVVAVAQLVRLYELSSKIRKRGEHDVSSRDNKLNANLMLLFMFVQFGGLVYLMVVYGWTGRGDAASVHGHEVDWLFNVNLWIIIAVFFLTNALLFGFSYKYVRKPGVKALYYPHNNRLELLWTAVPAVVLAVIIILGLKLWNKTTDAASKDAIVVELYSKQFDWTARYSGEDNTLGKFDYKLTTDNNKLGILNTETIDAAIDNMMNNSTMGMHVIEEKLNDPNIMLSGEEREKLSTTLHRNEKLYRLLIQMKNNYDGKYDAASWDDVILTGPVEKLYLCKGKQYEFNFRSKDVIHSAYFPHFRAQMNTVPGMTTRFKFTPDLTTEEMREKMDNPKFDYVLLCNKICGGSHYKMYMKVEVLEEEAYNEVMEAYASGNEDMGIEAHNFESLFKASDEEPEEENEEEPTEEGEESSEGEVAVDSLQV